MKLNLQFSSLNAHASLKISGSKSESNRLLLLQALYPEISLENVSDSDDSNVMRKALTTPSEVIDIHHAGTAMRFLTAYFSMQSNRVVTLTGSSRMKERPIRILVDSLRQLGAEISYLENEGFPPIKISGKQLHLSKVHLNANVSSQYISALLLIASRLPNGIHLTLEGQITSMPYINMTLQLLNSIGATTHFEQNTIRIAPLPAVRPTILTVESDWSSASYFYSIIALSKIGTSLQLSSYSRDSLQGDSALATMYRKFGVETTFEEKSVILTKISTHSTTLAFELNNTPDIAQTIAVTCIGLNAGCSLTGLHTLRIKETDRLTALETELEKLGGKVTITDDSLTLQPAIAINPNIEIGTYNDHRMAMAFAPLALKVPILIQNAEVVTKSYPAFWDDLQQIGFAFTTES